MRVFFQGGAFSSDSSYAFRSDEVASNATLLVATFMSTTIATWTVRLMQNDAKDFAQAKYLRTQSSISNSVVVWCEVVVSQGLPVLTSAILLNQLTHENVRIHYCSLTFRVSPSKCKSKIHMKESHK